MTLQQKLSRLTALGVIAAAAIVLHVNPLAQEMRVSTTAAPPQAVSQQPPMGPVQFNGTGLIVGQVIDAGTGRGVAGAIVTLGSSAPPGPQRATTEITRTVIAGGAGAPMIMSDTTGGNPLPRVLTDAEGRFAFRNVPKGAFALSAAKAGYLDGAYGRLRPSGATQTLDLVEGERQGDVKVRVFRTASIAGTIVDDTGEPVVGAQVRAYRRTLVSGRKVLNAAGAVATTDDRGVYRLSGLTPGEFIVGVPSVQSSVPASFQMGGGAMGGDLISTIMTPGNNTFSLGSGGTQVTPDGRFLLQPSGRGGNALPPDANGRVLVYPTQYYPSASTVSHATAVTLASGEDRTGVDLQLKLVPTATIAGHLVGPDGPAVNWAVHLVPSDTGDLSADPDVATTITDQNGEFAFLAVPAGQYVIQTVRPGRTAGGPQVLQAGGGAQVFAMTLSGAAGQFAGANQVQPAPNVPTLWAAQPVSVAGSDVNGVAVTLRQGQRAIGKIEFDGSIERPPADRLSQIIITVESADGKQRSAIPPTRVEPTGLFTLPGLLPGKYVMRAANVPGGWTFRSAMHGGTDLSDSPFDVSDKDITGIIVTFADRVAELRGTVKSSDSNIDPSASVIVFPADNRGWAQYGVNPRRMRIARASKTGAYAFMGLPPGDYYAAAINDEFASEWQDPQFLDALSRGATRLTIADGEKKTQDLSRLNIRPAGDDDQDDQIDAAVDAGSHGPFVADGEPGAQARGQAPPPSRDPRTVAPPSSQGPVRDATVVPATGTAVVSGRVTLEDGQPVRRARVALRNAETRLERAAATDENGRFTISALPSGRYTVLATKAAYLTTYFGSRRAGRGPGTSLALANGQKVTDVALTLTKGAVIAGTLRDDQAQPVGNALIQVMQYQTTNGVRTLVPTASGPGGTQTDDRGVYRIYGLLPGAYVVSASAPPLARGSELRQLSTQEIQAAVADLARPAPATPPAPAGGAGANASAPPMGRTVGYAQVYYPGTLDQAGAATVSVTAGQELLGIDFPMRLVATAKVDGVVMGIDGRPAAGVQVSLQQANQTQGQIMMISSGGLRTNAEGKFTATNVSPGRYTLIARSSTAGARGGGAGDVVMWRAAVAGDAGVPPPPPPMIAGGPSTSTLWAMVEIDINGEDIGNVSMTLQEGMTVSGKVAFAGKATTAPADLTRMSVVLFPASASGGAVSLQTGRVTENGTFQIVGVMPGKYRVQTGVPGVTPGQTPTWSLRSAIAEGRDMLDIPLDIKPGQNVDNLVVTFTDQPTELTGSLTDQAGKPAPGFTILVFSTDRAHWLQGSRRLAAPTHPASDGKFRIANLPPGEYFMAAVTELEPGDWGDTTFMEAVAAAAFKITLGEGEKKVQDVKIAG